jgi:hypothetical protein
MQLPTDSRSNGWNSRLKSVEMRLSAQPLVGKYLLLLIMQAMKSSHPIPFCNGSFKLTSKLTVSFMSSLSINFHKILKSYLQTPKLPLIQH